MATDLETLLVRLEAQMTTFDREMKKARTSSDKNLKDIENRFTAANKKISDSFNFSAGISKGLAAASAVLLGGGLISGFQNITKELGDIADASERLGVSTDLLQSVGFAVEQAGGDFEGTTKAIAKFEQEISQAGTESTVLSRLFERNGIALRDQNGALRDTGTLLGEFARLVANTRDPQDQLRLAAELFGSKVGPKMLSTLRDIAENGLPGFIQKMKEAGVVLEEGVIKVGDTIDDKWNALIKRLGVTLKTFLVNTWGEIQLLENNINNVAGTPAVDRATVATDALKERETLTKGIADLEKQIADTQQMRGFAVPKMTEQLQTQLQTMKQQLGVVDTTLAFIRAGGGTNQEKPAPSTFETNTQDVFNKPKKESTTSASTSEKTTAYDREIAQLREKIKLEELEAASIGLSTEAKETARAKEELLAALRKDQIAETPAVLAQIDELAAKYGAAAAAAEDAKKNFQELKEVGKEFTDSISDGLKGMLLEGKSFNEVLKDMVKRLASKAIDKFVELVLLGGSGGTGGLLGSLFGGARAGGGPVSPGRSYTVGERGEERFIPAVAGRIVPNDAKRTRGADGRGGIAVYVTNAPVFQAGMTPTDMAIINSQMDQNNQMLRVQIARDISYQQGLNANAFSPT